MPINIVDYNDGLLDDMILKTLCKEDVLNVLKLEDIKKVKDSILFTIDCFIKSENFIEGDK